MKKLIPAFVAIVLILLVLTVSLGMKLIDKYSYSKEKADLEEYFNLQSDEEVAIVLQDELLTDKALVLDGVYYFSIDTVHQYMNERFYEDRGENLLLYTTPDDIIRVNIGGTEFIQDGSGQDAGYVLARYEGDTLYISGIRAGCRCTLSGENRLWPRLIRILRSVIREVSKVRF